MNTLDAVLRRVAAERPDQLALLLPRGKTGFAGTTYAELDRRVDAIATGLRRHGIGPGVRTAFLVPPSAEFFALAFGLLRAGAVPVLVDPGIGLRHLRACLAGAAPGAFVGVPRAHAARLALRWCPTVRRRVSVGPALPGAGPTLHALERSGVGSTPPPAPAADPAAIVFTSGSTGPPKPVAYRHEHFLAQLDLLRTAYGLAPGAVSVATFPPFALLGPLLGLTTVVPRMDPTRPAAIDPTQLVAAVSGYRASVLFGSPALLDTVGRWAQRSGARLPSLRQVVSAGAPVAPAVQRRVLAMLEPGAEVHTPYGATEALPVTTIGSAELLGLGEPGVCVGRPLPGVEVAIMAITDRPVAELTPNLRLPAGAVGEIVVRGPNVTTQYAGRPQATALAKISWDGQPAHRMGDLGRLDPAGRLWFCGRKAHRVHTAAGPRFTSPAEEVLNTHPAVRRSALVGVGAPGAQRPVACIELEPGIRRTPDLTAELRALAASHPATAGITDVLYRRRFPVDIRHNSKIDRPALAPWAAGRLR